MKRILFILVLICLQKALHAQQPYIYTIKADSVKITNTCDTAELIIENHTQNVPGFLFNKGRGRTEFRRGLIGLNENVYLIGGDTLDFNKALGGVFYKQGGNSFGTTALLGTKDDYPLTFIQNGIEKSRIDTSGHWLFHTTEDNGFPTQFKGDIWQAGALFQDKNVNIIPIGGVYGDARINIGTNIVTGHASIALGSGMQVNGAGVPAFGVGSGENRTVVNGIGIFGSTDKGIAIGHGSFAHENAIAFGFAATTTGTNQFVCGGPDRDYNTVGEPMNKPISNVFFGSGVQRNNFSGPGISYTINGSGAYGTDNTGGDIVVAGGKGTGAATSGNVIFSTAASTSSGTTLQSLSEKARIAGSSGNLLLNTTTDAGYKLDVNGTSIVRGHAYFPGGVAETNFDHINSLGGVSVYGTFTRGTGLHMNFDGSTGIIRAYNTATGTAYPIQIGQVATIAPMIPNVSANLFMVNPFVDQQSIGSALVRGIYYNPSVANLDNTKHIAFGNTVGDNKLNINSGNTGIGLDETTNTTSKLDVNGSNGYNQLRLRQSYTPTSSSDTNGKVGDVSWDDNYFYIKTSAGWKRSALTTF